MSKLVKNILVYGLIAALVVVVAVLSVLLVKKDKPNNGGANGSIKYDCAYSNGEIGSKDVTVKLFAENKSLLICGTDSYWGTYSTSEEITTITIAEEIEEEKEEDKTETAATTDESEAEAKPKINTLLLYNYGDKAILEETTETDKIIANAVAMEKHKDSHILANGLWRAVIRSNGENYYQTSSTSYILKLSENEIYSNSIYTDAFKTNYYYVGNKIYIEYIEKNGKLNGHNIYYIEKADTHCKAINELGKEPDAEYGKFKSVDLIYNVESTTSNLYFQLVEQPKLDFGDKKQFTANMMSKKVYSEINEVPITVNLELTLNSDKTTSFKASNNKEYEIETSGVWYSFGNDSVIVIMKDKGFYESFFVVSFDNTTYKTCDGKTFIRMNNTYQYNISWSNKAI